jgi:hypothetical protein
MIKTARFFGRFFCYTKRCEKTDKNLTKFRKNPFQIEKYMIYYNSIIAYCVKLCHGAVIHIFLEEDSVNEEENQYASL